VWKAKEQGGVMTSTDLRAGVKLRRARTDVVVAKTLVQCFQRSTVIDEPKTEATNHEVPVDALADEGLKRQKDLRVVLLGNRTTKMRRVHGKTVQEFRLAAETKKRNGSAWVFGAELGNQRNEVLSF
jgi:hypothetical protein